MSIIALSGYIGSGKDTIASIIKKLDVDHDWKIKKFGYKLKQIATILTGIPSDKFEDQEFKKTYLGDEWTVETKIDHTLIKDGKATRAKVFNRMTVRDMLQKLGTEAIRNGLHPDTWVNALMCDYKKTKDKDEEYSYPNWIITDLRFPNEYDAIKSMGGIIIRVNREIDVSDRLKHISEIALDDYKFDYVIDNTSDMDHLISEVTIFLKQFNII
jgi:cytidylate kinase